MKPGLQYFCCVFVCLFAAQVYAADMSTWSNSSVCRLTVGTDKIEYIDEVQNRGLACGEAAYITSQNIAKALITALVPKVVGALQASIKMYDRSITYNVFVSKNDGYADESVTFDFNNDGLLDVLMVSVKYLTKIGPHTHMFFASFNVL